MRSTGRRAALAAVLGVLGAVAYLTLSPTGSPPRDPAAPEGAVPVEVSAPPPSLTPDPRVARPSNDLDPPRPAPSSERRLLVRVEDAAGRAVAGALVRAVAARRSSDARAVDLEAPEVLTGITDSTGSLELRLVDAWALPGLRVAAELADGWRCSSARTVATEETEVVLRLRAAWAIRGTVTGAPDPERARAVVLADLSAGPEAPRRRRIPVAADGSFHVLGVSGHTRLYATLEGRRSSSPWSGALTLGTETAVVLELGPPGIHVAVEAVDEGGDPVPGIAVWLGGAGDPGHAVRLDALGRGTTSQLAPDGEVSVYVPPSKGVDGTFTTSGTMGSQRLPGAGEALRITLPRCVRAHFTLRGGAGEDVGAGFDGLTFHLVPDASGQRASRIGARDGRIVPAWDRALPPGTYRLKLTDGTVLWSGTLDATDVAIPVTLPAGRVVDVEWTDAEGRPVSGTALVAAVLDEALVTEGKLSERQADGFEAFDAGSRRRFWVPAGRRCVVVAWEPGIEVQQQEVPPPGATDPVRFATSRKGGPLRIRGGVRFDLAPGVIVNLNPVPGGGPSYHATVDGSGTVAFPSVAPGRYAVRLPVDNVLTLVPDFDLEARADETVDVRLP